MVRVEDDGLGTEEEWAADERWREWERK